MLDHEKLDVYQCSIYFLSIGFEIIENIPKRHSIIIESLKRESISIPFNNVTITNEYRSRSRARVRVRAREKP